MNIICSSPFSPNLPKQLGAACWFDACRPGTLVTGDKVSSWTDLSGNSRHATQATDSKRPAWSDNIQRGRPGLLFSAAASQYLETSAAFTCAGTGTSVTMAFCGKMTSTSAYRTFFSRSTGSANYNVGKIETDTNSRVWSQTEPNTQGNAYSATNISNVPIIVIGRHNSVPNPCQNNIWLNGVHAAIQALNNQSSANLGGANCKLQVGCRKSNTSYTSFTTGYIFEIILFGGWMSDSNATRVEQYLSQKWGIKLA